MKPETRKPTEEEAKKIMQLADALIEGLNKNDCIHDAPAQCVKYCENAIERLRPIRKVGVSRRIIELEHLRERYAALVA